MDLRYPVGDFDWSEKVDLSLRPQWITRIAEASGRFREAVRGLDRQQLDTPYRPGGWTVRQVVHHVPDSHMNQTLRRSEVGGIARFAHRAGGSLATASGEPSRSLGQHDGRDVGRRLQPQNAASGDGFAGSEYRVGGVCLALPAS
jgi:hypothetical protein